LVIGLCVVVCAGWRPFFTVGRINAGWWDAVGHVVSGEFLFGQSPRWRLLLVLVAAGRQAVLT
jgi:hypothetical protein